MLLLLHNNYCIVLFEQREKQISCCSPATMMSRTEEWASIQKAINKKIPFQVAERLERRTLFMYEFWLHSFDFSFDRAKAHCCHYLSLWHLWTISRATTLDFDLSRTAEISSLIESAIKNFSPILFFADIFLLLFSAVARSRCENSRVDFLLSAVCQRLPKRKERK